jgi:hypothetical protein
MTVTNTPAAEVALGCWTILDDTTDRVRATVTRERNNYTVCDESGRILGRFPTARQALAIVAA